MRKVYICIISLLSIVQLSAQSNIFKRMWTDTYVLQSHTASFSFQIELADDLSSVDSLQIVTNPGFLHQGNNDSGVITFFDNGQDDDSMSGDRIYTASEINTIVISENQMQKPTYFSFELSEMSYFLGDSKSTEQSDMNFVVRWYSPSVIPGVNQVNLII